METKHRLFLHPAEAIEQLEPSSVDLVVTSPPYPMISMWDSVFSEQDPLVEELLDAGRGQEAFERMHVALDQVWDVCARSLRPGGFACINIGDATRSIAGSFGLYANHARIIQHMSQRGMQTLPGIIWRKATNAPNKFMGSGMLPAGAYVTLEHEHVLIFRAPGKRVFSKADTRIRRRSAIFWEERNAWFSDLWDLAGARQVLGGARRSRSAAFPAELPFRLIHMFSLQGDTVLDPFAGTGTTALAALAGARNSILYEIDPSMLTPCHETMAGAVAWAGTRRHERLVAHDAFVARRPALAYTNESSGVPVMTRQEIRMAIPRLDAVRAAEAHDHYVWTGHHMLDANWNTTSNVTDIRPD